MATTSFFSADNTNAIDPQDFTQLVQTLEARNQQALDNISASQAVLAQGLSLINAAAAKGEAQLNTAFLNAARSGTALDMRFSGDGAKTAFTLAVDPSNEQNTQVYINGIYQQKDTYSVLGTVLTFSEAPPVGTDNIEVMVVSTLAVGTSDSATARYVAAGPGAVLTTAQDALQVLELSSYADLRSYAGVQRSARVTGYLVTAKPSGTVGNFVRDDSDTTTADNGGTVIVANNGKRWKRVFSGDVSAAWFGVSASAVDNLASLQTALNASQGRSVVLEPGTYQLSGTLRLPTNTILRGTGMVQSILQASIGFVGTVVITYGDVSPAFAFASQLRDLTVDANDIAGLSCVDIYRSQESSGIFDCLLKRFRVYGVTCQNGAPANIELTHLWVWASNLGATACVNLNGVYSFTLRNSTLLSLNSTGNSNCGAGLALMDCQGVVHTVHFENVSHGVDINGNNTCVDFSSLTGTPVNGIPLQYLVYCAGGALRSTFRALVKGTAVHNFYSALGNLSSDAAYIGYLDGWSTDIGVSSPVVTGSPTAYTNTTMRPQILYLTGGAVTGLTVSTTVGGGAQVSLPASTPNVVLGPAQRCTITYSAAPTLTVYPL